MLTPKLSSLQGAAVGTAGQPSNMGHCRGDSRTGGRGDIRLHALLAPTQDDEQRRRSCAVHALTCWLALLANALRVSGSRRQSVARRTADAVAARTVTRPSAAPWWRWLRTADAARSAGRAKDFANRQTREDEKGRGRAPQIGDTLPSGSRGPQNLQGPLCTDTDAGSGTQCARSRKGDCYSHQRATTLTGWRTQ
jgi:hypothetical protein